MAAAAQRTPTGIAIERLAKLAAAGTSAPRMVTAAQTILIGWGEEELEADVLRERIEVLQSDVDAGVMAAEDYAAEADTPKSRSAALGQMEALTAVREMLAEAVGGRG